MSEHTSRLLALNEPALAPLRRDDLPSFLVSIREGKIIAATAACARLGLHEDQPAPKSVLDIMRQVAASSNGVRHLERVRLPAQFTTRMFSCASLSSPLGRLVLFVDPEALAPQPHQPVREAPAAEARDMTQEPRPVRFTWETDDAGVIRFLSESAVDGLGLRLGGWLGRSFRQLADAGLLRDSTAIEAAIQAGSSFADVLVHTQEPHPRRIVLGGMPLLDGMRRRTGVRGFGILWPPSAFDDTPAGMGKGGERDEAPVNVVPLRGGPLTQRERSAFHEIARTLHEAVNGWNAPQGARDVVSRDAVSHDAVSREGLGRQPHADDGAAPEGPQDARTEWEWPSDGRRSEHAGDDAEAAPPGTGAADRRAAPAEAEPDEIPAAPPHSPLFHSPALHTPAPPAPGPDEMAAAAAKFADDRVEDMDARPRALAVPAPGAGRGAVESADSLLDRLPIGIAVQQQGQFVRVNRTILGWAGVPDAQEFQRTGGVASRLWRVDTGGQLHFARVDGAPLPVEVRLVSVPWNGETALVHLVRAIEAAAPDAAGVPARGAHRARHEALDLIPVPVALLDASGKVDYLNRAALRMGSLDADARVGTAFATLFRTEDRHLVDALFASAARAEDGRVSTSGVRLQDGEGRAPLEVTIARTERSADELPAFCAVFRETPAPLEAAATRAMQDSDALLRRLSHGVREPLNVMFGFVEAVRSGAFGAIGTRRYSKLAEGAVLAGRQLMATLEDIEGLIAPPGAPVRTVLDVNALVDDAVAHLAGMAQRRRILIRRDFNPQATICCDAARTAQMLRLLLEEALRGTPEGQFVLISTLAEPSEAEGAMTSVAVLIRDEGASLSEEEIAQALDVTRPAAVADRFGTAGLPFRMARIAALARSVGGTLNLRRGIEGGMLSELRLPK
ncbi:PAS domain-containing protein [Roseixanthobacter liquoris]|uniref:PAS domain-containing protein n=1 Tax=Roseixanthobacter liquoris TaxID=3119921 RepID=UPI003729B007